MSTLGRIHYRVAEQSRLRAPLVWFRHRGLRGSDIILASYPRSGQYWLRFQLGELFSGRPVEYEQSGTSHSRYGSATQSDAFASSRGSAGPYARGLPQ